MVAELAKHLVHTIVHLDDIRVLMSSFLLVRMFLVGASFWWMPRMNLANSVNRKAALWNAKVLWPRFPWFLFNTYWGYATLVPHGTPECAYSRVVVTQGDHCPI